MSKKPDLYERSEAARQERLKETNDHFQKQDRQKPSGIYRRHPNEPRQEDL